MIGCCCLGAVSRNNINVKLCMRISIYVLLLIKMSPVAQQDHCVLKVHVVINCNGCSLRTTWERWAHIATHTLAGKAMVDRRQGDWPMRRRRRLTRRDAIKEIELLAYTACLSPQQQPLQHFPLRSHFKCVSWYIKHCISARYCFYTVWQNGKTVRGKVNSKKIYSN